MKGSPQQQFCVTTILVSLWLFWGVSSQDDETTTFAPVSCSIPSIRNGYIRLARGGAALTAGKTVKGGSVVQVACLSGFALSEDDNSPNSAVCQDDGQFTAVFKRCVEIQTDLTQCGIPAASTRVFGGTYASVGQFPWMVKLEIPVVGQRTPNVCGASLIAKNWLLTAAHCLTTGGEAIIVATALIGRTNFSSESEVSNEQRLYSREFFIHPNYRGHSNGYQYDFGLIKLNPGPILSDLVKPICLPDETTFCDNSTARNNAKVDGCVEMVAAGWGMTENGTQVSPSLKMVNLTVTSRSSCERLGGYDNISAVQFCAGRSDPDQDTCLGDSGGPLMCQRPGVTGKVVVGIVSYGRSCGRVDLPGVYGRVCKALPWIKSVVNGVTNNGTTSTTEHVSTTQTSSSMRSRTTISKRPTTTKSSSCTLPTVPNGYFTKVDDSSGDDTDQVIDADGATFSPAQAATLHCEDGFAMPSRNGFVLTTKTLRCSQSLRWNPVIDTTWCSRKVTCQSASLPNVRNGSFPGIGGNNFGQTKELKCHPGFRLSTGSTKEMTTTVCQPNGIWSQLPQMVNCTQIVCGKLPSMINGVIWQGPSLFGSNRNVTCSSGYQFQAGAVSSSITCQNDGTWTQPAKCVPKIAIVCPHSTLPNLENGTYVKFNTSASYKVGTTLQLKCNSGFTLASGTPFLTVKCQPSGTWSSLSSYCQASSCPFSDIPNILPANSHYVDDFYDGGTDNLDASFTLEIVCEPGYRFSNGDDSISLICQSNGQWSMTTTTQCQTITCSFVSLPHIANGKWQKTNGTTEYPIASTVSFSCNSGYLLTGSLFSVSCQQDGLWSELSGQCVGRGAAVTTTTTTKATKNPSTIVNLPCSQDYRFQCRNGKNVTCFYVCDGESSNFTWQCGDNSDEIICDQTMKKQHLLDYDLWYSAYNGSLSLVRSLLDQGANLETKAGGGFSSLHMAAFRGHVEVAMLFLDRGASINLVDNYGRTPLILTTSGKIKLDAVRLLVDRGADLNVVSNPTNPSDHCLSSTALMCAAEMNQTSVVQYLKSKGASRQGCTHSLCN